MRNSFIVNITLLLLINVLIKPAYIFLVEIPVQNTVGNEVFGMYWTFLNLIYIFQLLTDLGTYNFTVSELPQQRDRFSHIFSNIVAARLALGVLFFLLMVGIGAVFGYWQQDPQLYFMILVNILFVTSIQYVRGNVAALGHYFVDTWLSALDKFLMLIMMLYVLHVSGQGTFTIYTFAWVQMLAYAITFIVALAALLRHVTWELPSSTAIRQLMVRALPYAGLIALMALSTRIDPLMIEKIMEDGFEQAGLYASAYRLFDAMTMITLLFGSLLLPMFAELNKNIDGRTVLFYGALRLLLGVAIILAMMVITMRVPIMQGLYPQTTTESAIETLGILSLAFVCKGSLYVTSTLLTAHRAFKWLYVLFISAIVCNFGFNWLLIPNYGITGAACSTAATQLLSAVACVFACHKAGFIQWKLGEYVSIGAFVWAVIAVFVGMQVYQWNTSWLRILSVGFAFGLLFLGMNKRLLTQLSGSLIRR